MQARIITLEQEVLRLRGLNEKISLGVDTPSPGSGQLHSSIDSRPLSPPPEAVSAHPLRGQEPTNEHTSPPGSENGF
jgi:hypothetical protein